MNTNLSSVVSLDPPDYRGEESYRLEFSLQTEKDKSQEGFVHRSDFHYLWREGGPRGNSAKFIIFSAFF